MLRELFGLLLFFQMIQANYLSNTDSMVNFTDIPSTDLISELYTYPYISYGCSISDNNNNLYFVSSTYHMPTQYAGAENIKCSRSKKYVEIKKFNKTSSVFSNTLLIGLKTDEYPNAKGDLGSDNVVSCGYDNAIDVLYYIASNYYECPSNYNSDSSIVRINGSTFEFIDRTILRNIENVPSFSIHQYWEYKYINVPTTSELIEGDSLWLGFGGPITGIWKLNITTPNVELLDYHNEKYLAEMKGMSGTEENMFYERDLGEFKKSFKNNNMIYFISDTTWEDARVLAINTTLPLNGNNTKLYTLDGINYISVVKSNTQNNKIYFISGSLTSELYQYDFNFNKLQLNVACNIDFLKFPTEWGIISGMEVDYKTGYLYPLISNRYNVAGIAKINMNDLTLDMDSHKTFKDITYYSNGEHEYSYTRYWQRYNISHIDLDIGKIFIVSHSSGGTQRKLITVELYGCSHGKGIQLDNCISCTRGKYSNVIGGLCKSCLVGFASNRVESTQCDVCLRGKFGDGKDTVNCQNCLAGQFSEDQGASECLKCGPGRYSIISSSSSLKNCLECAPGKISIDGSVSCNFCNIGEWAKNFKECIKCSNGKYGDSIGLISNNQCKDCLIGYYNDEYGITKSEQCKMCEDGKIGFIVGAISNTTCRNCPAGQFKSDVKSCQTCLKGQISKESSMDCELCLSGKYSNLYQVECVKCPMGKYNIFDGASDEDACKLCPFGRYSNKSAVADLNECIECDRGKYNENEGSISITSCKLCIQGKFNNNEGNNRCAQCSPGYYSGFGHEQCKICLKGKYSNLYQFDCISCPKGKFNDFNGAVGEEDCKSCPWGRYSNKSGIVDLTQCAKCVVGKYNEEEMATSISNCKLCESGKFNNNEGSNKCDECRPGHYSGFGYQQCKVCSKGKYSLNTDESKYTECLPCPPGTFIDFEGGDSKENCISCPPGRYNEKSGSVSQESCIKCPMGYYSNTMRAVGFSTCLKCEAGKYGDIKGADTRENCISCQPGRWNENDGSVSHMNCEECPMGFYSSETSATTIETCIKCTAGKYNKLAGADSEFFCLDCQMGKYSITGSSSCDSCDPGKFSASVATVECLGCDEGKIAGEYGSILCEKCRDNSETNFEKTICSCKAGSYISNNSCIICPDEFECEKGVTIETMAIKKNYWRESRTTIETYKCRNTIACSGGIVSNGTNDLCSNGHIGPLCDICMKGWAKDDGLCLKCPENIGRSLSLTIAIPIVCIMIIVFLIKTANPSNNKKEEVNGVVKIFMNYAQVFSLASSFQINWPTLIRYLFERAKEFSSPRVSFYSSDCTIGWSYYDKLIVYLALPLGYVCIITILISILSCCFVYKQTRKLATLKTTEERNKYKAEHPTCIQFFRAWEKTAIVVGTFLSWPTIVEKTLEVMNCEKIGHNYYLIKDMSVECYTTQHYGFLFVAYIALGIYGVGIPYMGFRMLYKHRYRLFDMQNRYDGSTPLSFLFLGYREKRWYYEFIIMGKKAGLILISVFLRNHARYQIIAASLLVQITFFLHVFLKPYDTITSYGMICNKLESISLLSLVMTLSTGLFFGTIDSGYQLGTFEDVLIVILILSNGGVTLYFMVYFITLMWKTIKTHIRENFQKKFDDDTTPICLKCCNKHIIEYFKEWSFLELTDNYGIHLKTDLEKNIFSNYFIEKQTKLNILNGKIDNMSKKGLSVKLDKIRCDIQVMEKQRCWQTIQNNRLYSTLKKIVMLNKSKLEEGDLQKLEDVFNLYIQHGIDYNKKMDQLYMSELEDMVQHPQNHIINLETTEIQEVEMQNIIVVHENDIETQIII